MLLVKALLSGLKFNSDVTDMFTVAT